MDRIFTRTVLGRRIVIKPRTFLESGVEGPSATCRRGSADYLVRLPDNSCEQVMEEKKGEGKIPLNKLLLDYEKC